MLPLLLATLAFADIPPPPGYVEKCTLKNHPGCVKCDAWHGGREECEALENKGYTRACRTGGASVWDEIFCPPEGVEAEPSKPTPPPSEGKEPTPGSTTEKAPEPDKALEPEKTSRCATLAPGAALPLVLLPLLLLRRRRT